MRISDWSSDVCSSDLLRLRCLAGRDSRRRAEVEAGRGSREGGRGRGEEGEKGQGFRQGEEGRGPGRRGIGRGRQAIVTPDAGRKALVFYGHSLTTRIRSGTLPLGGSNVFRGSGVARETVP